MFLGIILGIILTIGAAYISDTVRKTDGLIGSADRPVVNWDVVERGVKYLTALIRDGVARLTSRNRGP